MSFLYHRDDQGYMNVHVGAIVTTVVGVVVAIVALIMVTSAWGSVKGNEIGLHYNGGPWEGDSYERIIQPGSGAEFLGPADRLVTLPIDNRSYITCNADDVDGDTCDGPDIVASTKGGAEMRFRIGASFKVNTADEVLREFYENVCRKFSCDEGGGWDDMLQARFRGPIEQAIQQTVRNYTVDQLFAGVNPDGSATSVLEDVQADIAADLKENINRFVGGDYFCGPSFDRTKPEVCPDFEFQITDAVPTSEKVREAFASNLESAQKVITAENNANAEVAEAEGKARAQQALAGLYTDPAYIAYLQAVALDKCAGNNNCTLIVGGDAVTISPQARSGG